MTETKQKGTLVSNGSACLFDFSAYWSTKNPKQHPVKKHRKSTQKSALSDSTSAKLASHQKTLQDTGGKFYEWSSFVCFGSKIMMYRVGKKRRGWF